MADDIAVKSEPLESNGEKVRGDGRAPGSARHGGEVSLGELGGGALRLG